MYATTKAGIRLNKQIFQNAISKAQTLRPRVVNIGPRYAVQSSAAQFHTVVFRVFDAGIWATCTCKAHTLGRHGEPMPCYHIAAAALARKGPGEHIGDRHAVSDPDPRDC